MKSCNGSRFSLIEPGNFVMGSPENEPFRLVNEKQHNVTITYPFMIQSTTVTVGLWRLFANETNYITDAENENWAWTHVPAKEWKIPYIIPAYNWEKLPSYHWDNPCFYQEDNYPVTNVSWFDIQEFIIWFNQNESKLYRLPTEAEWEYACRAGTIKAYYFGDKISRKNANISRRFDSVEYTIKKNRTVAADKYKPNKWGLYNMHGNVWEWCQDSCYMVDNGRFVDTDTYIENIEDPISSEGDHRVLRGGSWAYPAKYCRSAFRRGLYPTERASGIGFRLALTLN